MRAVDIVIPTLGRGGAQKAAVRLAAALRGAGARVRLLTFAAAAAPRFVEPPPGVTVVPLGRHVSGGLSPGSLPGILVALRRELARGAADTVVGMQDVAALAASAALSAARSSARLVVAERRDPTSYRHAGARRVARRLLYRRAALLVAQTSGMRDVLARDYAGPIVVIPNPCPPSPRPARPERPAGARYRLVAASRLEPMKSPALLVRAGAEALKARPAWTLELFGSGSATASLRREIETLGATDRVLLRGHSDDLETEYSSAHLFVHASVREGFPNAVAEAVGAGLPVVAYASAGGVTELVRDGVNGVALPDAARTPEALADALGALMDDDALRGRLGAGAAVVAREFAPERIARSWTEAVLGPDPATSAS